MRQIHILTMMVLLPMVAAAQLATGTWQMHFTYSSVKQIAHSADKVYALSDGTLYSVDKRDNVVEFYSKLSELNGTNISSIHYDPDTHTLLIIYSNGLIDLMRSGGVENISDLYQKRMTTSKTVNDVFFSNGNAYLATDFGIILLNMRRNELQSTYYIGEEGAAIKISSVALSGDMLYANTESTILYANTKTDNLMDYAQWKRLTPPTASTQDLNNFNGELVALADSTVYTYRNNLWQPTFTAAKVRHITVSDGLLFAYTKQFTYIISQDYTYTTMPVYYGAYQVVFDSVYNSYWIAAGNQGLAYYSPSNGRIATYMPDGPAVNSSFRLKFDGNRLYSVPGGRWSNRYQNAAYIMMYEDGEWTNTDYAALNNFANQSVFDFMNVAIDPRDHNHLFVTSYGCGLFEYQDMKPVKHYTVDNTTFASAAPSNPKYYTRLDGAVFDSKNNLWVVATGEYGPNINVMSPEGKWTGLNIYNNGARIVYRTPQELLIDNRNENYKWLASGRDVPGIGLLDDNGTPYDASDDRSVFRTTLHDLDNNNIALDLIYCTTQDKKGNIWVGTLAGPILIPASVDFFTSDQCERVKVPRNDGSNLYDYLLSGERINAIAIDGGGRKIMGTQNSGVYILSEDATETLYHFTTDNSPLPSNTIMSLAIHPTTGELYIGTSAGLVSYQNDATEAANDYSDVYAYPNPVRTDYSGVITIVGLMEDTDLRITDVAGNLVATTRSNGGMATWDGCDGYGRRVSTGIYLIMATDTNGGNHTLTRILVVGE